MKYLRAFFVLWLGLNLSINLYPREGVAPFNAEKGIGNLLPNGHFSNQDGASLYAWRIHKSPGWGTWAVDNRLEGMPSINTLILRNESKERGFLSFSTGLIPLGSCQGLVFSCRAKCSNAVAGNYGTGGYVRVEFLNSQGNRISEKSLVSLNGDQDWKHYEVNCEIPAGADRVNLSLGAHVATGVWWFQEMSLLEATAKKEPLRLAVNRKPGPDGYRSIKSNYYLDWERFQFIQQMPIQVIEGLSSEMSDIQAMMVTGELRPHESAILRSFLSKGGGVLIAENTQPEMTDILPYDSLQAERVGGPSVVAHFIPLDFQHPVLRGIPWSHFPLPPVDHFIKVVPRPGARVIAEWEIEGRRFPALIESRLGKGKILTFTSSLDRDVERETLTRENLLFYFFWPHWDAWMYKMVYYLAGRATETTVIDQVLANKHQFQSAVMKMMEATFALDVLDGKIDFSGLHAGDFERQAKLLRDQEARLWKECVRCFHALEDLRLGELGLLLSAVQQETTALAKEINDLENLRKKVCMADTNLIAFPHRPGTFAFGEMYDFARPLAGRSKVANEFLHFYIGQMQSQVVFDRFLSFYPAHDHDLMDAFKKRAVGFIPVHAKNFGYPKDLVGQFGTLPGKSGERGSYYRMADLFHPEFRDSSAQWIARDVAFWNLYPETVPCIDYWNEPILFSGLCYGPHAITAFQNWLRSKYKDVSRLNDECGIRISSFDEVTPPLSTIVPGIQWDRECATFSLPNNSLRNTWALWSKFRQEFLGKTLEFYYTNYKQGTQIPIRDRSCGYALTFTEPGDANLTSVRKEISSRWSDIFGPHSSPDFAIDYDRGFNRTSKIQSSEYYWLSWRYALDKKPTFDRVADHRLKGTFFEFNPAGERLAIAPVRSTFGKMIARGFQGLDLYTGFQLLPVRAFTDDKLDLFTFTSMTMKPDHTMRPTIKYLESLVQQHRTICGLLERTTTPKWVAILEPHDSILRTTRENTCVNEVRALHRLCRSLLPVVDIIPSDAEMEAYPVLLVPLDLYMSRAVAVRIQRYVSQGGRVIFFGPGGLADEGKMSGGWLLNTLFGVTNVSWQKRSQMKDTLFNESIFIESAGGFGFSFESNRAKVLAHFDNGEAALLSSEHGRGVAILWGLRLQDFFPYDEKTNLDEALYEQTRGENLPLKPTGSGRRPELLMRLRRLFSGMLGNVVNEMPLSQDNLKISTFFRRAEGGDWVAFIFNEDLDNPQRVNMKFRSRSFVADPYSELGKWTQTMNLNLSPGDFRVLQIRQHL